MVQYTFIGWVWETPAAYLYQVNVRDTLPWDLCLVDPYSPVPWNPREGHLYLGSMGFSHHFQICFIFLYVSQGRKKHMARPGLKPWTSRTLCEHSDHWASEPHCRPVTIVTGEEKAHCPTVPWTQNLSHTLQALCPLTIVTGGKSTWPDQDLNSGPLAYRANSLTTELLSHMVDLWHMHPPQDIYKETVIDLWGL